MRVPNLLEMPFHVNNVDCSVVSNFLFGAIFQTLQKEITPNQELWNMMSNSVDLLVFAVEEIIEKHSHLALLYYPSKYDFYWFVARNVHLLKRYKDAGSDVFVDPLGDYLQKLEVVMKKVGTKHLNDKKKLSAEGQIYWAEFLGNYAGKDRNEDAVFSTALAWCRVMAAPGFCRALSVKQRPWNCSGMRSPFLLMKPWA